MTGGEPSPFGAQLRRLREAAGLTQEALAERAGLTADAVAALERGRRRRPYPHTVQALTDALGLPEAERAALARTTRSAPAPVAPLAARPPLPAPPTPLIGREGAVAALGSLLHSDTRLVTLTGPGGVGKTRLAVEVARDLSERYPDGVAFVGLAPLSDAGLVIPTIAHAIGLREVGGETLRDTLRTYLRDKRMLLVLDNVEHVLSAAPEVAALVASSSGVDVLATSRAPLRVRGEREYPVGPLMTPDLAHLPDVRDLDGNPAVELFVERVRAVAPAFALTQANAATVAAICRRLDGLPLAIELAATRVRSLSPTDLLARLDVALPLLTGGARDLPERQRTMRAAIEWSYRLLEEPERRLLNRLSVFRGGWQLTAAEAVGGGGDIPEEEVLNLVSGLVERSLVAAEANAEGGTRYRLLVPVREYAEERLIKSGEAEETRRRHAEYFLERAERAEPELRGRQQAEWVRRLEIENDNLRAVLAWALGRDAEIAARLPSALRLFWEVRGYFSEGRGWLEAALAAGEGADLPVRAKLLNAAGWMAFWQGEYDRARTLFEESLGLYRRMGDKEATAASLHMLGSTLMEGDTHRAISMFEESIALGREVGDRRGVALPMLALAIALLEQGDTERPRRLLEEALGIGRATGDALLIARTLYGLAIAALRDDDYDLTRRLIKESMVAFQDIGHASGIAYGLDVAASAAAARRAANRAARLWGASEALRAGLRTSMAAHHRRLCAPYMEGARAQLGEESWGRARAEGREMTPEQAIAYALADAAEHAAPPEVGSAGARPQPPL